MKTIPYFIFIITFFGTLSCSKEEVQTTIIPDIPVIQSFTKVNGNANNFVATTRNSAVYFNNKFWVIGGYDNTLGEYSNAIYSSSDGISWTLVSPVGPVFLGRQDHKLVVFNNKMWIIGGFGNITPVAYGEVMDIWSTSDGATWTKHTSTNVPPIQGHDVVVFNNKLWIIGGVNNVNYQKVWSSTDGITWTQVATSGTIFSNRTHARVVAHHNKMFLIGGQDSNSYNDIWSSTDGVNWTPITTSGTVFSGRFAHGLVSHKGKLLLIGGYADDGESKEVWSSSDDGKTWQKITINGTYFAPLYHHNVLVQDNKVWVLGGLAGGTASSNVWKSN